MFNTRAKVGWPRPSCWSAIHYGWFSMAAVETTNGVRLARALLVVSLLAAGWWAPVAEVVLTGLDCRSIYCGETGCEHGCHAAINGKFDNADRDEVQHELSVGLVSLPTAPWVIPATAPVAPHPILLKRIPYRPATPLEQAVLLLI